MTQRRRGKYQNPFWMREINKVSDGRFINTWFSNLGPKSQKNIGSACYGARKCALGAKTERSERKPPDGFAQHLHGETLRGIEFDCWPDARCAVGALKTQDHQNWSLGGHGLELNQISDVLCKWASSGRRGSKYVRKRRTDSGQRA